MAPVNRERLEHPAWSAVAGTAIGYGLILVVLFVLLFLLPYAIFASL